MKTSLKTILLAALSLAGISAQAQLSNPYNGDLIVGVYDPAQPVTTVFDLGAFSNLVSGETWNLTSTLKAAGFSNGTLSSSAEYGVVGCAGKVVWATGNPLLVSSGTLNAIQSAVATIANQPQVESTTTSGGVDWFNETIANPPAVSTVISYGLNVDTTVGNSTGFNIDNAAVAAGRGGNPPAVPASTSPDGSFYLNPANDVLTYTGATAPVAAFTGTPTSGSVPLSVVFTNTSTGTITNWLWTFGDGHTFTNTVSGPATNTYTASGTYTVSLKVTGPAGTNTSTRTNYIVVSAGTLTASFTATPTNGFAPLPAVFTSTATGAITNWVWSFGNGAVVANTTGVTVTNTYAAAGSYTVALAVYGAAGSATNILTNYITVSPAPKLSGPFLSNGKLLFNGTNGPVNVQYRILTTTNLALPLASWTPVLTNTIPANGIYGYTNNLPTNAAAFFRLVSP